MPKKLSKKKYLRGGWGGPKTSTRNQPVTGRTNSNNVLRQKPKKTKKVKKGKKTRQNGGSWRSRSIFSL